VTRPAAILGTSAVVALAAAAFLLTRSDGGGPAATGGAAEPPVPAEARGGGAARPSPLPSPDAPGSARLSGAVTHRRTGKGLGGVALEFTGPVDVAVETGADGGYAVTLAPGTYRIAVVDSALRAAGPASVQVASGAIVEGVDIRVDDAATVAGRVVSGDGEPLAGAALSCRLSRRGRGPAPAPCGGVSGADGGFSMAVPAGAIELRASAPGGATSGGVALPWVLPGAELTGVEIVVDAGAVLEGRVQAPNGSWLAGAQVRIWSGPGAAVAPSVANPRPLAEGDIATVQSGPDGRFRVANLRAGRLVVVASHPDFAPSTAAGVDVAAGGRVSGLSLVLRKPVAIAGRVVDTSKAPLAGATVYALRSSTGERVAQAVSGADGAFELRGLDRGPFDLLTELADYAPGRRAALAAPATDVVLEANKPSALAGAVTAAGEPVTDFQVQLVVHVPVGGGPSAPMGPPLRVVDSGGRFRFDDLDPGSYQLSVSAPGLGPALVKAVAPAGATGTADVELSTGSSLVGRVTDADDGRPVAGALVTASTGFEGDGAYTDAQGEYRLRDIAAGRRSIAVEHPAYVGKIESAVEFGVGDRRRLDVRLERQTAGAAGGRVIEFAGIGAVISMGEAGLSVGNVLEHSPADVAGLVSGDRIVRIDGVESAGRSLAENIEDIRGVVGTSVRLELVRGAERFARDVVRGTVRFRPDE